MIASLKGTINAVGSDFVVLEVNGVGYRVFCVPRSSFTKGKKLTLLTHLEVKKDGLALYGFTHADERELFALFLSVSGCGPKNALRLVGSGSPADISAAIVQEDLAFFTAVSGVGKKLAEKVIFTLKDKFKGETLEKLQKSPLRTQALEALISLGYKQKEAYQALKLVPADITTTEECVRAALEHLARQ